MTADPVTHQALFPLAPSRGIEWNHLSGLSSLVTESKIEGEPIIKVRVDALAELASEAFHQVSHYLRTDHLRQLRSILDDPDASPNDRFVALDLLRNSQIAAEGILPMCQDTGTAIVLAKKGRRVWTQGGDEAALAEGIGKRYASDNLRFSQLAPLSMFEEKNTRSNLPAQIDLYQTEGDEYHFLFMAKGGGSANKTFLHQGTPSLLKEDLLLEYLDERIAALGTAACPPYHLAVVIGGTSAEANLKTVKLASCVTWTVFRPRVTKKGMPFVVLKWRRKFLSSRKSVGSELSSAENTFASALGLSVCRGMERVCP